MYTPKPKPKPKLYVRCENCDKLHEEDSTTYVTIQGNVVVGSNKGLVGDNFNEHGHLDSVSVFCLNHSCWGNIVKWATEHEERQHEDK